MSVDSNQGSARPNRSETPDSPQYVLRREERDHPVDGGHGGRGDQRRIPAKIWLILTQIVGVAILLPWFYVLLLGFLFLDTSVYRDFALAVVYASYPVLLILSWAYSWYKLASGELLLASLVSFLPIAASLVWVWFSIYVI
jgi:hypothetical protein